jgi:hypothetical protein
MNGVDRKDFETRPPAVHHELLVLLADRLVGAFRQSGWNLPDARSNLTPTISKMLQTGTEILEASTSGDPPHLFFGVSNLPDLHESSILISFEVPSTAEGEQLVGKSMINADAALRSCLIVPAGRNWTLMRGVWRYGVYFDR